MTLTTNRPPEKAPVPKLLFTLAEVTQATGIGRTALYAYMKDGRLRYVRSGDRRLVRAQDLDTFIDTLAVA